MAVFFFQHLALNQLRGREWERDYSQAGESKTLLMPSTALVKLGDLKWDRCGSWQDARGQIQIQDPWWSSDAPAALLCRAAYMDRFLTENDFALLILGFQMKFVAGNLSLGGRRLTERTLFIRYRNETKLVKRNIVRD
jgi:hypothetical protein